MMTGTTAGDANMNGAAIVLSDGREIPITETMVQSTLDMMADAQQAGKNKAGDAYQNMATRKAS